MSDRDRDRRKKKKDQDQQQAPQTGRPLKQPRQRNNPSAAGLTPRTMPGGAQDLAGRIRQQPQMSALAMGQGASPGGTPQTMPLAQVIVSPVSAGYSTVAYRGIMPLWTTDGAAVPAFAPGRWAQLAAAGRP